MKKIQRIFIAVFFGMLMIPMVTFTWEEDVVSRIDNRKLAENPLKNTEAASGEIRDLTEDIEEFVSDRIGLRDQMILAYTKANDVLFHEMVHPIYTYGEDDYVFFRPEEPIEFDGYHVQFAQMVANIQQYCEERNVPFLFVFNPAKTTVLEDKLQRGICYHNEWVSQFLEELYALGVNYVDNTGLLCEKAESEEMVFNRQYDAGHWNDLGAYYGVNQTLEVLSEKQEGIHINQQEEFDIGTWIATTLPVSDFSIHDEVPYFEIKYDVDDLTDAYEQEVKRDEQYPYFRYSRNSLREKEGAPKALVFQGSYMNMYGFQYLDNSFGEYVAVHDYQNVMDVDYYYNIFLPDCVIFEVAEYAVINSYFDYRAMADMDLNPACSTFDHMAQASDSLSEDMISIDKGKRLSKFEITGLPKDTKYAYLKMGETIFDLSHQEDETYTVTVENKRVDLDNMEIIIITSEDEKVLLSQ